MFSDSAIYRSDPLYERLQTFELDKPKVVLCPFLHAWPATTCGLPTMPSESVPSIDAFCFSPAPQDTWSRRRQMSMKPGTCT